MSRVIELPDANDLARRYLAGESTKELAREFGVHVSSVARRLKSAGVNLRGVRKEIPDISAYIERYLAGESEKSLSGELGVNRFVFRLRLQEAGVKIRGRSEGMTARWARTDEAGRSAMLSSAHAATKGRKMTADERTINAKSKELTQAGIVPAENILANDLRNMGYTIVQQKAIGIYNIDIALDAPPLAVEVFGGGWHAYGRHIARFHERVKYLLNSGWNVLIVWVDGRRYPITADCAQYIHAFIQELSRNPAGVSQYRVILGNGQDAPVKKSYLNTPADIERFSHGIDAAGGTD